MATSSKPIRIVFMGTPVFAQSTLAALAAADWAEVALVVTQPDERVGRRQVLTPPPVKETALALRLPVAQPRRLRAPEAMDALRAAAPDVIVVAAYGQILRPEVLRLPAHGCLNVHASLLPAYRGASPIAAAIRDGAPETGVSIMLMDEGIDTGAVLSARSEAITPDDTAATLGARLATVGAQLLTETVPRWLAGNARAEPQGDTPTPYCRLLTREDGRIDWTRPADDLERLTRAMDPWPGAWTLWRGRSLKVVRAAVVAAGTGDDHAPGAVITQPGMAAPVVACGKHALALLQVQPEGKAVMDGAAFARGQRDVAGTRLG